MRTHRLAALIILLAVSSIGCPKTGTTTGPSATPKPSPTTGGGLMRTSATPIVVALPEPGNPVVSIRLVFRSGSADDPKGKEGLADLTATVMADGGTAKLAAADLVRALYPMAADLFSTTDREMTVFVGRCHRDHLSVFLPLLADVLLEPRLDPKEFERLRTDAVNDLTLRLRTSDDENLGKELVEAMLAPSHGYGHPSIGTESGLTSITLDDVKAFRKKAFGAGRLTIGIAGGYDPTVFQAFQQRLAGLPPGDPLATPAPLPVAAERNILIVEKPTASSAVSMGFNIDVKRGDPDFFELRMAMAWFGEHRQGVGRLFNEIREKRGLNYGNYAYAEDFVEQGGTVFARNNIARRHQHFEMWIRPVENKNALFATRAALWQFDSLLKNGMGDDAFREMRDWLQGYSRLWELTTDRRLGYAIDGVYYETPAYLDTFRKSLAKMTAAQVNDAVRRRLSGKSLQIAIVTQDGGAFRDAIVGNKPTPAIYESKPPEDVLRDDKTIEAWPFDVTADRVKVMKVEEAFK